MQNGANVVLVKGNRPRARKDNDMSIAEARQAIETIKEHIAELDMTKATSKRVIGTEMEQLQCDMRLSHEAYIYIANENQKILEQYYYVR